MKSPTRSAVIFGVLLFVPCGVLGQPRQLRFAGQSWWVRSHHGGPGGADNVWSDSPSSVWVDSLGRLHLKLRHEDGVWKSAEVFTANPTRHGLHRFHLNGRLDELDPNVRVGLFLYSPTGRELDIEVATWKENMTCQNASFSIHPAPVPADPCRTTPTYHPFQLLLQGRSSTHSIDWMKSAVTFRSTGYFGCGRGQDIAFVQERTFREPQVELPSEAAGMRVHINLWLGSAPFRQPARGREVEIVIEDVEIPVDEEQMASRQPGLAACSRSECPGCDQPTGGIGR